MPAPLAGVRAVEVASHVFVPMAGSVLAEWGAEVIKIESPQTGDAYRGLVTQGLHRVHGGVDPSFQLANRGKRSVGIDLKHPDGRRLLSRLLAYADVFLTNVRLEAVRRLHIDVDDIRADNPSVIYVRASAFGRVGPDAHRGGYDSGSYWSRTGMQDLLTPTDAGWPVTARPAFGDVVGGLSMAGAVSAALYRRATTGEPSVIDSSLFAMGMWQLQTDITYASLEGPQARPGAPDRYLVWNPLNISYRTADGRYIALMMVAPDRQWPNLCKVIGQPERASDPRFADMDARRRNARACVEWLDSVFAERDYDEWRRVLADFDGEWAPVQRAEELQHDAQALANGYLTPVDMGNGTSLPLVPSPVQFDERPGRTRRAPEHGEHTEEVLLELGLTWDEIVELKDRGAIL
jgi:crotonobetainyl-CoA:carnitine CoA-transferase CaiB-like acyl-CoA transferase